MKAALSALVTTEVGGCMPCMPLRGTDAFARPGGDIDFMVPAGRAVEACHITAKAALSAGWFLAGFRDIGYLAQVVLVAPRGTGGDSALKIDFFDGLHWYGVGVDAAGETLLRKYSRTGDMKLAAAATFFQKTLIAGGCSDRDWARVRASGADASFLSAMASQLSLPLSAADIHCQGVIGLRKWRVRAASGGSFNLWSGVGWFFRAALQHLKTKLEFGTGAGLVVGVSGLDGSGKSTLLDRFTASLRDSGALPPRAIHLLPRWIPMPHQVFRRAKTAHSYTKPYLEPPVQSRWSAGARLTYYLLAFLAMRVYLCVLAKGGRIVVLDRSFVDFAADLTRARIPERTLPDWVVRALSPPGLIFYLHASPDSVVRRKGELSLERARSLEARYDAVATLARLQKLNGDLDAERVFRQLLEHISAEFMRRLESRSRQE